MIYESNYISHHGILGQKWGVRRYQNKNGSLTPAGIQRYRKPLKRKHKIMSSIEDCKATNPGFNPFNLRVQNNCVYCTATFELRRRGYDVHAKRPKIDGEGITINDFKNWFTGSKVEKIPNNGNPIKSTRNTLLKQGDNARGNLLLAWDEYCGHSVAYEIQNGKVKYYDCQSGKEMNEKELNYAMEISYIRLDDKKFNFKYLNEVTR